MRPTGDLGLILAVKGALRGRCPGTDMDEWLEKRMRFMIAMASVLPSPVSAPSFHNLFTPHPLTQGPAHKTMLRRSIQVVKSTLRVFGKDRITG